MSLIGTKKLFVDATDEITKVINQITDAPEEKIILVVPENSRLFSNIISMKIVQRMSCKAQKSIILVTEDEFGISSAQKIGFLTVNKVSQINDYLWDIAKDKLIKYNTDFSNKLRRAGDIEEEFVGDVEDEEKEIPSTPPEVEKSLAVNDPITNENNGGENTILPYNGEEKEQEKEMDERENVGAKSFSRHEDKNEEKEPEEKKEKNKFKIVQKGNIAILPGGDITKFNNLNKNARIQLENLDKNTTMESKTTNGTFAGRDFSGDIEGKGRGKGVFSKIFGSKKATNFDERLGDASLMASTGVKKPLLSKNRIAMLAILLIGLVGFGILYLTASVSIIVELKENKVDISETIQAQIDLETPDLDNLIIRAEKIKTSPGVSRQENGQATGKAQKGTKATGFVTIYNTTSSPVTIAQGTKIINATGDLQYSILKDVQLAAISVSGDAVGDAEKSIVDSVPVEAIEIGALYNITDSEANSQFRVEGFDNISQVYAKRFMPFEGGNSEEFITPSEDDINKIKETLSTEVENESYQDLRSFVPAGYKLIDSTITYVEDKAEANPKAGEEIKTEDKIFSLSIEGHTEAIVVSCEDLKAIPSKKVEGISSLDCEDIEISNVVASDTRVTFNVSSQATVKSEVSIDEIKEDIKGEKLSKVEDILLGNSSIKKVKIMYKPFLMPGFFRYVPTSDSRISISIK